MGEKLSPRQRDTMLAMGSPEGCGFPHASTCMALIRRGLIREVEIPLDATDAVDVLMRAMGATRLEITTKGHEVIAALSAERERQP